MGKTAIVIGATGLVGRALTDQLADAPHISHVVTLTRRLSPHSSVKVFNNVINFDRLKAHASLFEADIMFSCLKKTNLKSPLKNKLLP
ncbi:NAD-dependent epimerase/dehydratase family protein [Desulfocicer niacini]